MAGGLLWIPKALSTLNPATSPRLSAIRIDLDLSYIVNPSVETMIEDTGNDLRRVVDEVARIEREFGGTVKSNVFLDPAFAAVLERLDVTFNYYRSRRSRA